jgi:CRP/FNR family cyclic AMP-dependent transcriptional regulator
MNSSIPQNPSEQKFWYLRNHKLFSTLSNAQIDDLCIITKHKGAKKGEAIYFGEDLHNRIFLLKRGIIKIVEYNEKGDEIIKDIIQKGDLFGSLASEENESNESAVALSPEAYVCSFRISDFENIISKNPDIALKYFKFMGLKLKKIENKYTNLVFKDVKTRLKAFLTDWVQAEGRKVGFDWVLDNYLTHQDIAGLICSTRQTVTQLMRELETEGHIKYDRKEILIHGSLLEKPN